MFDQYSFGIIRSYMSTISLIDVYLLDSRRLLTDSGRLLAVSGFLDTAYFRRFNHTEKYLKRMWW